MDLYGDKGVGGGGDADRAFAQPQPQTSQAHTGCVRCLLAVGLRVHFNQEGFKHKALVVVLEQCQHSEPDVSHPSLLMECGLLACC